MKNLKGSHTSLTPLSEEIYEILAKQKKNIQISPGYITRKNIKVTQVSITLKIEDNKTILCVVLMKGSKQYLRIYGTTIAELKTLFQPLCSKKHIILK